MSQAGTNREREIFRVPKFISKDNQPYVKELLENASSMQMRKGAHQDVNRVRISDLVSDDPDCDAAQLQWVQLVLAAAGVLGISYIGFIWMLEAAGIRFLALCGTSAGAILAGIMASQRQRPNLPCSSKVLDVLKETEFSKMWNAKKKWKDMLKKDKLALCDLLQLGYAVCSQRGLASGDNFKNWLKGAVSDGRQLITPTWGELLQQMCLLGEPEIKVYDIGRKDKDGSLLPPQDVTADLDKKMRRCEHYPLRLVATELTTQNMLVFPRDADLFYMDPIDQAVGAAASASAHGSDDGSTPRPVYSPHPADFITASSAIIGYFQPFNFKVQMPGDPAAQALRKAAWQQRLRFVGEQLPKTVVFADGAILSDFPIHLFQSSPQPSMPKIGITVDMGHDRNGPTKVADLQDLVKALASTTRHLNDRNYQHAHPVYKHCMARINATDFNQMDFDLTPIQQEKLLIRGMEAGRRFLEAWRESKGRWQVFKDRQANLQEAKAIQKTP